MLLLSVPSAGSGGAASALAISAQALSAPERVARAAGPVLCSPRFLPVRAAAPGWRSQPRRLRRVTPLVACDEASAAMPQSRSFPAKVSRQRSRSSLRGFRRWPSRPSARTLICTRGLAWCVCRLSDTQ